MPILPIFMYVAMIMQAISRITDFIGKFVKPTSSPKPDEEQKK